MNRTINKTLDQVNRIRSEYGLNPLDDLHEGVIGSVSYCPIANSLKNGHRVTVTKKAAYINGKKYKLDRPARKFVKKFDRGRIAEYRMF